MVEMGEGAELSLVNEEIENFFPRLVSERYRIASPRTPRYNCIAWAAGDDTAWWEPDPLDLYYWPYDVPRQPTLEAYTQAFRTLGYTPCDTAKVEAGFEKIAIYVDNTGRPTHLARQLPDGKWTSKLGKLEDIEHPTLEGLTGSVYGSVRLILRRRI